MEFALGSKRLGRLYVWFLTKSGFWRGLILVFAALFVAARFISLMWPAVVNTTTFHEVYLPTNVQVVKNLTNMFVEYVGWGGAGGIAMVQVELDLDAYKAKERESSLHYLRLDVARIMGKDADKVYLNYYGKNEASTHIMYAESVIDPPWANYWGIYKPLRARVENGRIVVDRVFAPQALGFIVIVCGVIAAIAVALAFNAGLSSILRRLYNKLFG